MPILYHSWYAKIPFLGLEREIEAEHPVRFLHQSPAIFEL